MGYTSLRPLTSSHKQMEYYTTMETTGINYASAFRRFDTYRKHCYFFNDVTSKKKKKY